MKFILSILVFTFTATILYTIGNSSAEMEELRIKKIAVDNTKEKRLPIKQANSVKALVLKNNRALQKEIENTNSDIDLSFQSSQDPLVPPSNVFPDLFQDQTEANIIIKDYRGQEAHLIQEPSSNIDVATEDYKKKVLSKLFSSKSTKIKTPTSKIRTHPILLPTNSLLNDNNLISIDESLNDLDIIEQNASTPSLEDSYENFNFSKQEKLKLNLTTETTNGKILPNTRLTIENSQGQILLEGSSDLEGHFRKELTVFTGEKFYVRYYGVGISQEKNEITKQGEK